MELDTFSGERAYRLSLLNQRDHRAEQQWASVILALPEPERERLNYAFSYARAIDYNHDGLSSEGYFSHPLRVANMSMEIDKAHDVEKGVVAILHNVLEVSRVTFNELEQHFGSSVSNQIRNLTVDRSRQWDVKYKKEYYARLLKGLRSARVVKIFDKLDNMFMLCLNPDTKIREKYLWEIETFLLPMVETTIPELKGYFSELLEDCRRIGFSPSSMNTGDKKA